VVEICSPNRSVIGNDRRCKCLTMNKENELQRLPKNTQYSQKNGIVKECKGKRQRRLWVAIKERRVTKDNGEGVTINGGLQCLGLGRVAANRGRNAEDLSSHRVVSVVLPWQ
jgi:hypothetical protein